MQRVSTFLGITLAATAVTAGMLWVRVTAFPADTADVPMERAGIGIEHRQPLPVTILASRAGAQTRIELRHTGEETIRLSVPAQWQETEIRGAKMSDVATGTAFGVRTYGLPPNVAIVFSARNVSGLDLYNPSRIPVNVLLKRIDDDAGFADESSVLIQESPSTIW